MMYLIASDIHGDILSLKALYDIYHKEHFDALILLGDILGNAGNEFSSLLKKFNVVVACKGNCDYSFDETILGYQLLNALDLKMNGFLVHIEHGHNLVKHDPQYQKYDIVFSGHTHYSEILKIGNVKNPFIKGTIKEVCEECVKILHDRAL